VSVGEARASARILEAAGVDPDVVTLRGHGHSFEAHH
jgi:hypothetical protein